MLWGMATSGRGGAFKSNIEEKESTHRVLVLMDVFCDFHGLYLTDMARAVYGVRCVHVLSEYMANFFLSKEEERRKKLGVDEEFGDGMPPMPPLPPRMPSSPEEAIAWRRDLVEKLLEDQKSIGKNYKDVEIKGLICESDPGLDDAESLSSWLNVTNHNGFNEARRNKFMTISTLASNGIPTVQQKLCNSVDEAEEFARDQFSNCNADVVVVKPVRGCASDDVFLCRDIDSVRVAYEKIKGSTVLGSPTQTHNSVLIQEYAAGQEYAIDTVSKNGKLKIAAVWKYDKRPQPPTVGQEPEADDDENRKHRQVYYATKLYDDDVGSLHDEDAEPLLPMIYKYLDECLNALDIRWGITHSELIITADGPRLVEVNCRQHNMDFVPLTDHAVGYNLYELLLAAYFGDENDNEDDPDVDKDARVDWNLIPDFPSTRMNAAMIHLVNDKKGTLKRLNEDALYEIQSMQSVFDLQVYPDFLEPGVSVIEPTIDIKSDAGWIQMIHPNPEVFQRDYDRIMELMPTIFEV